MDNVFEIASKISTPIGLAGITIAALFLIFREILKKDIFPTLTRSLSSDIIRLLIHRLFVLALVSMVLGFAGFALTVLHRQNPETDKVKYRGRVTDLGDKPIHGAEVQIRDDKGNIEIATTNSSGYYEYSLTHSAKSADFKVNADKYEPYEILSLAPGQTEREPLKMTPNSTPTPNPVIIVKPPHPSPRPTCSAEDRAQNKC